MAEPERTEPEAQGAHEDVYEFDPSSYGTVESFNEAFIGEMVDAARARRRAHGDVRDRDGLPAIDESYRLYLSRFEAVSKAQGFEPNADQLERAWRKVRARAEEVYLETPDERLVIRRAAEPADEPMPEPPPPPQAAAREQTFELTPEHLDTMLMERNRWKGWGDPDAPYSEELGREFATAFLPELHVALDRLPDDPGARERGLGHLKDIYQDKLFTLYMNQYPELQQQEEEERDLVREQRERTEQEYRANIQTWLDDRWNEILAAAQAS